MKRAKTLKHKKYTKVRVNNDGRREAYNSDTGSWVTYAAIAYMLSGSDRAVASSCDTDSFSPGGGDFGGGGSSSSWDSGSSDSGGSSDFGNVDSGSSSDSGGSSGGD